MNYNIVVKQAFGDCIQSQKTHAINRNKKESQKDWNGQGHRGCDRHLHHLMSKKNKNIHLRAYRRQSQEYPKFRKAEKQKKTSLTNSSSRKCYSSC